MKKSQIEIGRKYIAKVSGKLTTVRVDNIRIVPTPHRCIARGATDRTVYDVTNLKTDRRTTFRSAQKFRREVKREPSAQGKPRSGLSTALDSHKSTDMAPHVIVEARAGTGKTTTLVEGLRRVQGQQSELIPSPQQAAVWKSMEQSAGKVGSICFVAFSKSIAKELQERVPTGCNACTMHSLGFKAVRQTYGGQQPNSYVVQDTISAIEERDIRELRKHKFEAIRATEKLVDLCKMNLIGWTEGQPFDAHSITDEQLGELASYYDVDLNGGANDAFRWTRECLDRGITPQGKISFADMIWLPVVANLAVQRYDLLLVDEAQDLNRCQQQLALKAGRRLVLCGDPKQAIYGFAGADAESMPRMQQTLEDTERGCVVLPLTVTRRCGRAIVEEARDIVPDFEAHESNSDGKIGRALMAQKSGYTELVQNGDMCLCRVNAPLVSQCFQFLKAGRKANIQGRDVGQGLISTIKKMKADDVGQLLERLSDWLHNEQSKENRKRNPSEARLIALQDRYDCLQVFCEDQTTVDAVIAKIDSVFTDDRNGVGIRLSSVHKAKGLESRRVFLLEPEGAGIPHPMARSAWQREQEMNLRYVAITRAIEELVYVK